MTSEKGRAFILKVTELSELKMVGGFRASAVLFNSELVNVASDGPLDFIRKDDIDHVLIESTGIFTDAIAEAFMLTNYRLGIYRPHELVFEDGIKLAGDFRVTYLKFVGVYNGERTWDIALKSSGVVMLHNDGSKGVENDRHQHI